MMIGNFEFATAGRILFGPGTLREIPGIVAGFGKRALLLTGRTPVRAAPLAARLQSDGISVFPFAVTGEPTLDAVDACACAARQNDCRVVLGFGGGSVIDTGKAVAAILANGGELLDYLEVIGKGRLLTEPSLPFIAIPTTAGTGAEVTRNAVITSVEHRVKVSLRSPFMLPRAAVVDPETTLSLTPALTAATGMDALTQLIEPFLCNTPNPMTDALCREGIGRVRGSIRRAFARGDDLDARTGMSLAGLLSGIALANARLGAVHGLAGPLGGVLAAPHGSICARLLPLVMRANLTVLKKSGSGSPVLERFSEVARLLTGKASATPEDGIDWVRALCEELGIPPLSRYGFTPRLLPAIAAQSAKSSSMRGNPVALSESELLEILDLAL